MNAMVDSYPAFLYRPSILEDCFVEDEQPRASRWSRVMDALSSIRSEVMDLFRRGRTMGNGQVRSVQASQPALAEKDEADAIIKAIDRYRRLNGERYVNHLLRNLLQQSNQQMRDLGVVAVDDQRAADAEIQVRKAQAAAAEASEYANHFAAELRGIEGLSPNDTVGFAKDLARKALKWRPGTDTKAELEQALASQGAAALN